MRRDPRAYLADIRDAGGLIAGFIAGLDLERYRSDPLVRSGTERQLEIIGEALSRLSRTDPDLDDPCTCGSGRKWKVCHGAEAPNRPERA